MELRLALARLAEEAPAPPPVEPLKLNFVEEAPLSDWSREVIYGEDGR